MSFIALIVGLVFVLSPWPWLIRNYIMYDDPLLIQKSLWRPYVSVRESYFSLFDFFMEEFQGFRWSYWDVFGQFAVLLQRWTYHILTYSWRLVFFAGATYWFHRIKITKTARDIVIEMLPVAWLVLLFISFSKYNSIIYASQGRLLYPAGHVIMLYVSGGLLYFFQIITRSFSHYLFLFPCFYFCIM